MAPQEEQVSRPRRRTTASSTLSSAVLVLAALTTLPSAALAEETGTVTLTEADLTAYDGTDASKPIYLGINGTIFDVSASPAFYGPGGHYHHFVGKDATRAWVTECWDTEDQFTWRMEGVEAMFIPKWMDEQIEKMAAGDDDGELDLGGVAKEGLTGMAKKAAERFGKVSEKEKAKRRVADKEEAEAKVQETLAHWVSFFSGNAKYKNVGSVVRDESRPEPPKPCAEAMKKRPVKGGKLEEVMGGAMAGMMGGGGAGAGAGKGEMPAFVKEKLAKEKKEKENANA